MMNETSESGTRLAGRVRTLLDADLETLDRATQARLRWSRAAALRSAVPARRRFAWAQVGAFATLALAFVLLLPIHGNDGTKVAESVGDLDLLVTEENLEMLEDYEFFLWLEEANAAG